MHAFNVHRHAKVQKTASIRGSTSSKQPARTASNCSTLFSTTTIDREIETAIPCPFLLLMPGTVVDYVVYLGA